MTEHLTPELQTGRFKDLVLQHLFTEQNQALESVLHSPHVFETRVNRDIILENPDLQTALGISLSVNAEPQPDITPGDYLSFNFVDLSSNTLTLVHIQAGEKNWKVLNGKFPYTSDSGRQNPSDVGKSLTETFVSTLDTDQRFFSDPVPDDFYKILHTLAYGKVSPEAMSRLQTFVNKRSNLIDNTLETEEHKARVDKDRLKQFCIMALSELEQLHKDTL